jgi:dTDP-4-dehydrorhamnose 3,5-epimerase
LSRTTLDFTDIKVFEATRHDDAIGFDAQTDRAGRLYVADLGIEFLDHTQFHCKAAGTVRGLHMQAPPFAQHKLVRVTRGAIRSVCVDIRVGSPSYGRWASTLVSLDRKNQVFVPIGFLHGYVTLQPDTEVLCWVSNPYNVESAGGVVWDDPDINIRWEITSTVTMSEYDFLLPSFRDFTSPFIYEET